MKKNHRRPLRAAEGERAHREDIRHGSWDPDSIRICNAMRAATDLDWRMRSTEGGVAIRDHRAHIFVGDVRFSVSEMHWRTGWRDLRVTASVIGLGTLELHCVHVPYGVIRHGDARLVEACERLWRETPLRAPVAVQEWRDFVMRFFDDACVRSMGTRAADAGVCAIEALALIA